MLLAWLRIFHSLWGRAILANIQCVHHLFINHTCFSIENFPFFPGIWNKKTPLRYPEKKRTVLWVEQWADTQLIVLEAFIMSQKTGACWTQDLLSQPTPNIVLPALFGSENFWLHILRSVKRSLDNTSWSCHSDITLSGLSLVDRFSHSQGVVPTDLKWPTAVKRE